MKKPQAFARLRFVKPIQCEIDYRGKSAYAAHSRSEVGGFQRAVVSLLTGAMGI